MITKLTGMEEVSAPATVAVIHGSKYLRVPLFLPSGARLGVLNKEGPVGASTKSQSHSLELSLSIFSSVIVASQ